VQIKPGKRFWQAQHFIETLPDEVAEIARDEVLGVSVSIAAEIKKRISLQQYAHQPLSPRYLAWKKRRKLDERILIATGHYINAIGIQPVTRQVRTYKPGTPVGMPEEFKREASMSSAKTKVVGYRVGLPDKVHPPSGLRYHVLAMIHEYGSPRAHIPARPHWYPAWRDFLRADKRKTVRNVFDRIKKRQLKPKHRLSPSGGVPASAVRAPTPQPSAVRRFFKRFLGLGG